MKKKYTLSDDAVVIDNGSEEIRIRKGVWNYEEAVITLENESDETRCAVKAMLQALRKGDPISPEDYGTAENELICGLKEQDYIVPEIREDAAPLFGELPGGIPGRENEVFRRPILFFSDDAYVREEAGRISELMSLPVHVMSRGEFTQIRDSRAFDRTDSLSAEGDLNRIKDMLEPYACVVGGASKLNMKFMRNLNRGLIACNMPLSMAFIDGPFSSVFVIRPPETGCFECMEQRILARMEEHTLYSRFEKEREKRLPGSEKDHSRTPLLAGIVYTALFEGLSISSSGRSRLAGRALNTYIPVMEIQVQDILRVPYCPACGSIAMERAGEMYTSSRRIVDTVINRINLV